jgi:hypothetical protein
MPKGLAFEHLLLSYLVATSDFVAAVRHVAGKA